MAQTADRAACTAAADWLELTEKNTKRENLPALVVGSDADFEDLWAGDDFDTESANTRMHSMNSDRQRLEAFCSSYCDRL